MTRSSYSYEKYTKRSHNSVSWVRKWTTGESKIHITLSTVHVFHYYCAINEFYFTIFCTCKLGNCITPTQIPGVILKYLWRMSQIRADKLKQYSGMTSYWSKLSQNWLSSVRSTRKRSALGSLHKFRLTKIIREFLKQV
jgi:hypothetical protein